MNIKLKFIAGLVFLISVLGASHALAQATPNRSGVYYNANEAGYGLFIEQNGSTLVPAWYTYDSDGKPLWFLVSGASLQADGAYTGDVYRFTGTNFSQINALAVLSTNKVGTARLQFPSADRVNFEYVVNGIAQTKSLTKLDINPSAPLTCTSTTGSRAGATNYTDMWWNANQSGWGMNIIHQGDVMFMAWYTYDAQNKPMWITGLANKQADGIFRGDLNRPTSGTPFNQINGAAATSFPVPKVGTFEMSFSDGENGSYTYTLDGVTQTKSITRFVFGSEVTTCSTPSNNPGGSGGTYNLGKCARNYVNGEEWVMRAGGVDSKFKAIANGTFEGTTVTIVEGRDAQNRLVSKGYFRINGATIETVASESFDPVSGALTARSKFSPFVGFEHTLDVGYNKTIQYRIDLESFNPPSTGVYNYTQTLRVLNKESVTVAAGTFNNACKSEVLTTGTATVQGFTVSIPAITVTSWLAGNAPQAPKTVTPIPINGTTSTAELVGFTPSE